MKILVIGGNGVIGSRVAKHLKHTHEVIIGGRSAGDVLIDIADTKSMIKMFDQVGTVDAIVNIAGEAKWDHFNNLSESDYYIGIRSKLMGQVNLVRIGQNYLNKDGSITLSTGVLADDPELMTTSAAMVNGGIHSFVKAVALELKAVRINVVCADLVEESYEHYKQYFPGVNPVPMSKVINAYVKCIEGHIHGQIIKVKA